MLDEFTIISIQQGSDCFRRGKFNNQFRQIYGPETQSSASVNASNTDYSSINSLSPSKDDEANSTSPGNSHHLSTDSEDDKVVCDISVQADQAQLCQPKQSHDLVLGKTDASLVKKLPSTSDAPLLYTEALFPET